MMEAKKLISVCLFSLFSLIIGTNYLKKSEHKIEESKYITDYQDTLPYTVGAIQSNFTNTQAIRYCEKIGMRTANENEINRYYTLYKYKFLDESPAFTIGKNINLELNSYFPKEKKYDFNSKQDNYTLCIDRDILSKFK